MRLDKGVLVGASIPVITLSAAYIAYALFRVSPVEAAALALSAAALMYLAHLGSGMRETMREMRQETSDLEARLNGVARNLTDLETDVIKLAEIIGERPAVQAAPESGPSLAPDMQVLASLVRDLAGAVAAHDKVLGEVKSRGAQPRRAAEPLPLPRAEPEARKAAPPSGDSGEPRLGGALQDERLYPRVAFPAFEPAKPAEARAAAAGLAPALHVLNEAVESGRLDLFLQPIVTLPQRKTAIYEATLRPSQSLGAPLPLPELRAAAAEAGLAAALDLNLLRRAERLLSGFSERGRETQMIAPLSLAALRDPDVARFLRDAGQRDPKLARNLIIGVPQSVQKAAGPLEAEAMAAISASGLRLALTDTDDLKLDLNMLAAQGVKFLRLTASRLLLAGQGAQHGLEIHTADLSRLLERFGIQLIAEGIGSEAAVLDLLDYQVPLAQGDLFAAARQVRPEVLVERPARPAAAAAPKPPEPAPPLENPARVSFRSLLRRAAG